MQKRERKHKSAKQYIMQLNDAVPPFAIRGIIVCVSINIYIGYNIVFKTKYCYLVKIVSSFLPVTQVCERKHKKRNTIPPFAIRCTIVHISINTHTLVFLNACYCYSGVMFKENLTLSF